jgi:hypothetical protein
MSRLGVFCVAASIFSVVPVLAQDAATLTFKTGRELLNAPQKYIGRSIVVTDGFCVFDEPNVVCFGNQTPFEVKAGSVRDPHTLARLKDKCGDDLPGKEHDPTPDCKYSFSFIPTSVRIGVGDYVLHDLVQSNKRLVLFESDVIEMKR